MHYEKKPHYDLKIVKQLVSERRYCTTKKSTAWLRNHGYDAQKAQNILLCLKEKEFIKSLPPTTHLGLWADVYCCGYEDNELKGIFYVKFVVDEGVACVVLMSCKEWGYQW